MCSFFICGGVTLILAGNKQGGCKEVSLGVTWIVYFFRFLQSALVGRINTQYRASLRNVCNVPAAWEDMRHRTPQGGADQETLLYDENLAPELYAWPFDEPSIPLFEARTCMILMVPIRRGPLQRVIVCHAYSSSHGTRSMGVVPHLQRLSSLASPGSQTDARSWFAYGRKDGRPHREETQQAATPQR